MRNRLKMLTASVLLGLASSVAINAQTPELDKMKAEFQTPPSSAMPLVWWHWIDGNVSKDGIKKDIDWMKRSGIAGFHHFDVGFGMSGIAGDGLNYMSDEWKEAFQYALSLAEEYGMEVSVASSPGWSLMGGPWVENKDAMKKLSWREMTIEGGKSMRFTLPSPYSTIGTFQDANTPGMWGAKRLGDPYYEDIAVIAVKIPSDDLSMQQMDAKLSASGGAFTLEGLTDGSYANAIELTSDVQGKWLAYKFAKNRTIKSVSFAADADAVLESSSDGIRYTEVMRIPAPLGESVQMTVTIPETSAKCFRLRFPDAKDAVMVSEFVLYTSERVNHFEEKAGFSIALDNNAYPSTGSGKFPQMTDVVDLTNRVDSDGNITWNAPKGNWRIYRFGYSLTGQANAPAHASAIGLEVDKFDPKAIERYFETYLDMYKEAAGGLLGKNSLRHILTDSYEAGIQNWTPKLVDEFKERRGYSMLYWMPVLAGQVIVSPKESDKFLFDFRKTIGELIQEGYDRINGLVMDYGLEGRYSESHEGGRVYLVDGMDVKKNAAIPMSAAWVSKDRKVQNDADIRESSSVAHIFGQNIVAGESMTADGLTGGAYSYYPGNLKATADAEMAAGLNRFIIHEVAHQPSDELVPGMGLLYFGQWFGRNETWAEQAKAWMTYLGRSSYMLQQGKSVADVLVYYGEDSNITAQYGEVAFDELASGYSYDFINPTGLIEQLSVKNGKLVTESGQKYEVLYLNENCKVMSMPVLEKLKELADAGAFICGTKPERLASRSDSEDEFKSLVNQLWGGKYKNVTSGRKIIAILKENNVKRDVTLPSSDDIFFVHRATEQTDIYWISKPSEKAMSTSIGFRVTDKVPHIWNPVTGEIKPVSYQVQQDVTFVTLSLDPADALFIVFGEPAETRSLTLPKVKEEEILTVDGTWTIAFQQGRGAPEKTTVEVLKSFTDFYDTGVRYFSGEAVYTNKFNLSSIQDKMVLDLGEVGNIAEVKINGKPVATLWKAPYKVDVTKYLRTGENSIEIKVVNLWVNRIIGDLQDDAESKITTIPMPFPFYKAQDELLPSGLIGPVRILSQN